MWVTRCHRHPCLTAIRFWAKVNTEGWRRNWGWILKANILWTNANTNEKNITNTNTRGRKRGIGGGL